MTKEELDELEAGINRLSRHEPYLDGGGDCGEDGCWCHAGMEPYKDGDYVRLDDVKDLVDALRMGAILKGNT